MCGILAISSSKNGQFDIVEFTETDSVVIVRNMNIYIRGMYPLEDVVYVTYMNSIFPRDGHW